MSDIRVNFLHPTDGRVISVTLDATMLVAEAVNELIANEFILQHAMGYNLGVKGGPLLQPNESFLAAGVRDGADIRVIPATDAGGGIPGLDFASVGKFNMEELRKSPEAFTMVVRMYVDLDERYERTAAQLEIERFRSQSRLTATLLLLVAQVVLSIGASLLLTNPTIGTAVLVAGGLQALLATYLAFRQPTQVPSMQTARKQYDLSGEKPLLSQPTSIGSSPVRSTERAPSGPAPRS